MSLRRTRASGNPSKDFFVSMLTRDITLDDCILDLVDNSIDGAWEQTGAEPNILVVDDALGEYHIDIQVTANQFMISDNCGGITLDDAADYAFTFGRRSDQEHEEYSVGVYGIGMKRAVFKMGHEISIRSTYSQDGVKQSFEVPINVLEWLSRESQMPNGTIVGSASWDFDIQESEDLDQTGVRIVIKDLIPDIADRLGDPTYARYLRGMLGRDYLIPLMRGLRISVNGVPVQREEFRLRANEDFAPLRVSYRDGEVGIELVAGMISSPPDSGDPDENDRESSRFGWYVVCNGRVVLDADKTRVTGWGTDLPKWHRQYDGFVGFIFFSAENAADLPMTTTKRSVDVSAGVYRRALTHMHAPARAWISYTNARKTDLDAAKEREQRAALESLVNVAKRADVKLPDLPKPASRERVGNINFAMPITRLKALARGFGDSNMTNREVGIRSFDFAYDELVEDEI